MSKFELEFAGGVIICRVSIMGPKGKIKEDMILDTGSSITTISLRTAAAVGLNPIKSRRAMEIITAGDTRYAVIVTAPKIKFFDIEIKNVDLACLDLPTQAVAGGLLGMDILSKFNVNLNFLDNSLEIFDK